MGVGTAVRIEDLTLVLRPRGGFQAADLGMGLVRANARVIWLAWRGGDRAAGILLVAFAMPMVLLGVKLGRPREL